MRFMVLVPASKESEAGVLPDEHLLSAMGRFNEELARAGVLLAGEGLQASSRGARLQFSGGAATVAKGPFPDLRGLVAGFWLIQAKSLEDAIAWMQRAPFGDGVQLELRQIFEAEDFAPADPTGKLRADETALREQLSVPRRG